MARLRARARGNAGQIALDQRYPGTLDRNLGARSHRDTYVCLGERGRVIHAVPRHGDNLAVRPQLADNAILVLRQDIRLNIINAMLTGHGLGGGAIVSSKYDDMDAARP